MARRVVETRAKSIDNEQLMVISIYEEGLRKSEIKRINPYSKRHGVLYSKNSGYELKGWG